MKIKILNNIAKEGLDILGHGNFQIVDEDVDPSGIVLRSHDLTSLQVSKNLIGIEEFNHEFFDEIDSFENKISQ